MHFVCTLAFWTQLTDWVERNLFVCPSKRLFLLDCPGCGFQRSFLYLMKGEWVASFTMYPALIPVLFLWVYLVLHLIFRFRQGARNLVIIFISCCSIITAHYIYKIVQLQLI